MILKLALGKKVPSTRKRLPFLSETSALRCSPWVMLIASPLRDVRPGHQSSPPVVGQIAAIRRRSEGLRKGGKR